MNPLSKILIFVPTYNEANNVENILKEIMPHKKDADILFIDDNSPDGTGEILESLKIQYPQLIVKHRLKKLGIGSAHKDGINWAYKNGYEGILTLDCDATHPPEYITEFFLTANKYDVVVGSRHLKKSSLQDWSLRRKLLTKLGFWLTFYLLRMPYDSTGAYRFYNLKRIPKSFLTKVRSQGYSFFFESLFVLHKNNFKIGEVPIHLPTRINDQSKMRLKDIFFSLSLLSIIFFETIFNPNKIKIKNEN